MRNKEESKQKLLEAVEKIISRDGFKAIGINSIAKEANLDKVLIYRYFDGLDGLLREYARQKDFYLKTSVSIQNEVENAEKHELKNIVFRILSGQLRDLLKNKELQELILWEMMEKNELTIAIAKEREEIGYKINNILKNKMQVKSNDSDAVIALLVAGIYYLVLRSKSVDIFNGVDLNSESGWQQVENAIKKIINSYFD